MCTVFADGTCVLTAGGYGVAVSGHQPHNPLGEAVSNTVTVAFQVSNSTATVVHDPLRITRRQPPTHGDVSRDYLLLIHGPHVVAGSSIALEIKTAVPYR